MIWAYMGPPAEELPQGKLPELPDFECIYMDPAKRYVTKQLMECNWAQAMEGDLDGAHFSFLHVPAPSVKANHHDFAPVDEKRLNWIRNDPIPASISWNTKLALSSAGSATPTARAIGG